MGDTRNISDLPPGFRFYPTDEELVVHFLQRKVTLLPCHPDVIPDLHLHHYDPWELDGNALNEGKQWYFYSRRTQNRTTNNGYWKAMGMEEAVVHGSNGRRVGIKTYFVFYIGDGRDEEEDVKTNWIMHEYRLSDSGPTGTTTTRSSKSEYTKWVVCRVYETNSNNEEKDERELSCLDEVFLSMDDLDEINNYH